MGTNYFIRSTKPRMVYDTFHIGKTSAGWEMHFQDSRSQAIKDEWCHIPAPHYDSAKDIQDLLESEEYQLVDEYGNSWNPGEESSEKFQLLMELRDEKQVNHGPGKYIVDAQDFRDEEGYWFSTYDFR